MTENPSHAEREVERARADLSNTLDALKEKLSFGQLFDEARTQFMSTDSGEFFRNLARQARDNPMPAVLAGLGLLWLMMGGDRERRRSYGVRDTGEGMGERAQQAAQQMGMGLRSTAETMRDTGQSAAERARAAAAGAGEAVQSMAGTVSHAMSTAGESASGLMHSAKEAALGAGQGATRVSRQTKQTVSTMLEQQPLLAGAIGLAIGVALGAMLPKTRMEDEYLGETRDQLREAISEQTGQLYERGKVTATEVYRAAAEEARAQGLMPEDTGGETLAEKAEKVLSRAGEAAKEAGKRELGAAESAMSSGQQGAAAQKTEQAGQAGETGQQMPGGQQAAGRQPPETIKPGHAIVPEEPPLPPPAKR